MVRFDFADQTGVLFEWNESIDKSPDGLIEDDVIPYQPVVVEVPEVTLEQDRPTPMPTIEDKLDSGWHGTPGLNQWTLQE